MPKSADYRSRLEELEDWIPFLRKHSGLPGPRGNLELAHAVSQIADRRLIEEFLSIPIEQAPENTPEVFLVFCGVASLGTLIARGDLEAFRRLRMYASDSRWRIREAVAIGLQTVGDQDTQLLLKEMENWVGGNWYEKRAVAAALAEPRLLQGTDIARQVLKLFDRITLEMESASSADESYKVLRQAMGYCWSVAVAALPDEGKPMMERWLRSPNKDIRWIVKENLKKNRLLKMDSAWVEECRQRLE